MFTRLVDLAEFCWITKLALCQDFLELSVGLVLFFHHPIAIIFIVIIIPEIHHGHLTFFPTSGTPSSPSTLRMLRGLPILQMILKGCHVLYLELRMTA